jgi:hypothetical protein
MLTRQNWIDHILMMKKHDPDYAREALKTYHAEMPWLDMMNGVKDALK